MKRKLFTFILSIFLSFSLYAEITGNEVDQHIKEIDATFEIGEIEQALLLIDQLVFRIDSLNNVDSVAFYYLKIGKIFRRNSVDYKAIEYINTALSFYDKSSNSWVKSSGINQLGGIYYRNNEYEKAQKYWNKSLQLNLIINDLKGLSDNYNNLGLICEKKNELTEALALYQKTLAIKIKIGDLSGIVKGNLNIANLYTRLEEEDSAFFYAEASMKGLHEFDDQIHFIEVYIHVSGINLNFKRLEKAEFYARKSLEYTDTAYLKHNEFKQRIYQRLADLMMIKGKADSAFSYQSKVIEALEILNKRQLNFNIAKAEKINLVKKKDKEILNLIEKAKIEKRNYQLKQKLLWTIISALFILSILIFIVFRLRNMSLKRKNQLIEDEKRIKTLEIEKNEAERKQKEIENNRLRDKVDHKNKELSMATLHLIGKNETLNNLLERFDKIPQKSLEIIHLRNEIKAKLDLDKDWNQFKLHFENVHENFFSNLMKEYPDLTAEEFRLCAYLRINLNSKEIAQILNVQTAAINKRRTRLRRKLQLKTEENLLEFLSNI